MTPTSTISRPGGPPSKRRGPRFLLFASIGLIGCGSGEVQLPQPQGELQKVKGKVLLGNGRPLAGATVYFVPVKEPGLEAMGKTDSNGEFELTSREPGDGALEGAYKVRIGAPPPKMGSNTIPPPPFPLKYMGEDTSKLTATVQAGTNTIPPFRLK